MQRKPFPTSRKVGNCRSPFFPSFPSQHPIGLCKPPKNTSEHYAGVYDDGYEVLAQSRLEAAKEQGIIPSDVSLPLRSPNVLPWDRLSPEEQKEASTRMEIYAAMVELIDENVGKVVNYLKRIDQYEHTLIVFMSDNGAEGNWPLGIANTEEWVAANFDNSPENLGRKTPTLPGTRMGPSQFGPLRLVQGLCHRGRRSQSADPSLSWICAGTRFSVSRRHSGKRPSTYFLGICRSQPSPKPL